MNNILPSQNDLEELIFDMSKMVWNIQILKSDIDNWLMHFDGSYLNDEQLEHRVALLLLSNYVHYNIDEVRFLCKKTFKKFIHFALEHSNEKHTNLNDISIKIVDETVFIPIGNPSESGSNLLYYYRQENMIPKNRFYFDSDVNIENSKNIVFIDDVSLSGTQVVKYFETNKSKFIGKKIFFTPLILTSNAKQYIEEELVIKYNLDFVLLPGILLDEREQVFSNKSYIFGDDFKLMNVVKGFVEFYSDKFTFRNPFGYNNCQLALGFFYNIPNNTLPIFWANTDRYSGIFKRSSKVYGDNFKGVNYYDKHRFV